MYLSFDFVAILWSGCFVAWIKILTRGRVDPNTWTDCKLGTFLFYVGRHYSSTLLVLMSIEKCFAVYFPLKSKTVCTVRTAKWATGAVGVILAAYDLQWFVVMESSFDEWSDNYICIENEYYYPTLDIIESILYSFGPFILMFITNFAIVLKFMKAKFKSNQSTESTSQALVKSATRGTAMVVTVSVTFLILTAPTAVNQALWHVIYLANNPIYLVFMIFTQYLNHSINGVLYCIVGSRFRRELLNLFYRKKMCQEISTSHSLNITNVTNISGSRE